MLDEDELPLDLSPVSHDDRRRHGRIRSKDVRTRLGEVLDLSASGMRVSARGARPPHYGTIMHLELKHPEGAVQVKSRVVWIKRIGFYRFEVGLEFEDVTPTTAAGLVIIARLALHSVAVALSQANQPAR